ncbi:MAG TPA: SPFH domain-containing protein, partial [Acidimicrobiia bacterium]
MDVLSESPARTRAGVPWLIANVILGLIAIGLFVLGVFNEIVWLVVVAVVLWLIGTVIAIGFYMVQPNQAA